MNRKRKRHDAGEMEEEEEHKPAPKRARAKSPADGPRSRGILRTFRSQTSDPDILRCFWSGCSTPFGGRNRLVNLHRHILRAHSEKTRFNPCMCGTIFDSLEELHAHVAYCCDRPMVDSLLGKMWSHWDRKDNGFVDMEDARRLWDMGGAAGEVVLVMWDAGGVGH